ncbi:MAG: antifreeze protein [Mangrovicoccus sp.]
MFTNTTSSPIATPIDVWRLGLQFYHIGAESQAVIAMRLMGMGGFWKVSAAENSEMVLEKPLAFAQSANEAMKSALNFDRPDEVLSAAVAPIRKKTAANAHRLAKAGMTTPIG